MKRKIISLLLIISLVIQCVPQTALAAEGVRNIGELFAAQVQPPQSLQDAQTAADKANLSVYDNGKRTIDLFSYIPVGYRIDISQASGSFDDIASGTGVDAGLLVGDPKISIVEVNNTNQLSFELGDIPNAGGDKKIKFAIPVKKTEVASEKGTINLNITVKETKVMLHPGISYDGSSGLEYSGNPLDIKKWVEGTDLTKNVNLVYYDCEGDAADLESKNISVGAEWYFAGQKEPIVGARPKIVGNYEVILYIEKKDGTRISETTSGTKVDIRKKKLTISKLETIPKLYDGTTVAELDYQNASLSGFVNGEDVKISEESKKNVTATFKDPYVNKKGEKKDVTLSGKLELVDGEKGVTSNYELEQPKVKGIIEAVKREIELKPEQQRGEPLVVTPNSNVTESYFEDLEKAITEECLTKLKSHTKDGKTDLQFKVYVNGRYEDIKGRNIEAGQKYEIQVVAPDIDKNVPGDNIPGENIPEYTIGTKTFMIVAKNRVGDINITPDDRIEYTGDKVKTVYSKSQEKVENGIHIQHSSPVVTFWQEKVGPTLWKDLGYVPVNPGKYRIIVQTQGTEQESKSVEKEFTIEKKAIEITRVVANNRKFAENDDSATITELRLKDNLPLKSDNYNILDATFTDFNVGKDKKVNLTIELRKDTGAKFYEFRDENNNSSSIISLKDIPTVQGYGEISQAEFLNTGEDGQTPIKLETTAKAGIENYFDLTDYLCNRYEITITKVGEKFDGKPILGTEGTESKGIKFTLKDNAAETVTSDDIIMEVKSPNYRTYTIILTVKPTKLDIPTVLFNTSDRIMYNGGKPIYFKPVTWGTSFTTKVNNGIEYKYSGDVKPVINWYEVKSDGTIDGVKPSTLPPTKAGKYKLELDFAGTQMQEKFTVIKDVVVEERHVNVVDFAIAKKTYDATIDGDLAKGVTVTFKDINGNSISDIQKSDTNGYSITKITYGNPNVGKNIPVMIEVKLNGAAAKNYKLKKDKLTLDKGEIIKATHKVDLIEVKTQLGKDGEADLSKVITDNAEISIDTTQTNDIFKYKKFGNETIEKPVHIADNKLMYTIKDVDTIGFKKEGIVTLNVKDPNYENYAITIKVKATSQDVQDRLFLTCGTALKFGDSLKLSYKGGSGTGAVTFKIVEGGTGEAHIRENKTEKTWYLDPVRIGKVEVYAVKAADDRYAEAVSSKVTVTISKGTAKGTPTFTPVVRPGVKLSEVVLGSNNMIPPGGEFKWSGTATTIVEKGKAYKWTYTPADKDKDNYGPATGELVPYVKDDPNAIRPEVILPTVPSVSAGKDTFGMTTEQQSSNKVTIENLFADILHGVQHTVPADAETKRTEKAIQDEMKKGAKMKIKVEARKVSEGQVSQDASKIKTLLDKEYGQDKYTVIQYGAITVKAQTEDKHIGYLTELNQRISFTIQLPSRAYGYYHMARIHGGKAELLDDGDVSFDPKTKRVSFFADRFSTYMLFRTGQGGGDLPGDYDPNDPNNPNNPNYPGGPNDPNNPNNPNYPGNKPGYIYPVTNIKLATDHGLIRVSFTESITPNIKYYSIAYRPMKRCTCGRWHDADNKGYKYKGIHGNVTTIKVKKNVPYKVKVSAVTDYGYSIYKYGGIRYANRVGNRPSKMYDPHIYSSYSKKGSRSMTIKVKKIRYSNQPSPIVYQYFYKRKGTKKWYSVKTTSNVKTIKRLRKGKTYSVKVRFYYKSRLSSSRKVYSKYDYDSVRIR